RLHRARAAPAFDPVSEAPSRQSHVRGPVVPPAAQAEYLRRDPANLCFFAAVAADDGFQFYGHRRTGIGLADDDHDAALPRAAVVSCALRRPHRVLRLLLYCDYLQSDGNRRQPEEAWRLHSWYPPGRAYGRIHRLRAVADHRDRCCLSGHRLPVSRDADLLRG